MQVAAAGATRVVQAVLPLQLAAAETRRVTLAVPELLVALAQKLVAAAVRVQLVATRSRERQTFGTIPGRCLGSSCPKTK